MAMNAQTVAEHGQAENMLTGALKTLFAVAEAYPELKANQNFLALQDELSGTENRISVERRRYNEAVNAINGAIRRFPTSIIAGQMGLAKREYFEASEGAKEAPKVEF
jgi:LemA protein